MSNTTRFTVVLTVVCLAAAGGVGSIYLLTRNPIAEKAQESRDALEKEVLPEADSFRELAPGSDVYAGLKDGRTVGYVAEGEAGGYGGKLQVMVGLDTKLVVVKAAVLVHHETPGLGAECASVKSEDTLWTAIFGGERSEGTSWMDQFSGKRKAQLVLGSGVDARTGCTITSKAVIEAVRNALEKVEKLLAAQP
ncbi:MAG TPA: FMN-binding protein [Planctomycetota bacterium]|nr:FMN-binding protein [Planctomycetota bacterium]